MKTLTLNKVNRQKCSCFDHKLTLFSSIYHKTRLVS